MEKVLGRYLYSYEDVHHIDEDKHNNSPDNLMVFRSHADHVRHHKSSNNELIKHDDGTYSCILKQHDTKCVVCGNITNNRKYKYCSDECVHIAQRRCDRPNKKELYTLLCENSFVKVGNMFDVSDTAIRKWCKSYGLSSKAKDYK